MVQAGMVGKDPQLGLLASEVIRAIGNRASGLNAAANSWGARVALLALGDPVLALRAIAWAAGTPEGPPPEGPERLRWISRQAEARDLIVFSVSEGYHESRAQLGPSRMPDAGEFESMPAPPPAAALDDDDFDMAESVEPEMLELDLDDPGMEEVGGPPGPPPGPPGPPPARGGPPGPPPARMQDPPPPDFDDDEDDDFVPSTSTTSTRRGSQRGRPRRPSSRVVRRKVPFALSAAQGLLDLQELIGAANRPPTGGIGTLSKAGAAGESYPLPRYHLPGTADLSPHG